MILRFGKFRFENVLYLSLPIIGLIFLWSRLVSAERAKGLCPLLESFDGVLTSLLLHHFALDNPQTQPPLEFFFRTLMQISRLLGQELIFHT